MVSCADNQDDLFWAVVADRDLKLLNAINGPVVIIRLLAEYNRYGSGTDVLGWGARQFCGSVFIFTYPGLEVEYGSGSGS